MKKKKALISVSDKTNIVKFASDLISLGYEIISTGGSADYLSKHNLEVTKVSELTEFPECFSGRVKTLHPKIHGGLLARRDSEMHMAEAIRLQIPMIDLLVVNLYPFENTVKNQSHHLEECIEQIDIGGPALLRSAAKNFHSLTVITDIEDYDKIISEIEINGEVSHDIKLKLAVKAFSKTACYDSLIANYLSQQIETVKTSSRDSANITSDKYLTLAFQKLSDLRYGENPGQKASLYKKPLLDLPGLTEAKQLHGKELSYNNYADTDAAMAMLKEFNKPTVVVVKHSNPCGIASADTIDEAWNKAYQADPISIFGGIVVQNKPVSKEQAEKMSKIFLEVVLAPSFDNEALQILTKKKNIRLLELAEVAKSYPQNSKMVKEIYGGLLIQDYDQKSLDEETYQTVTMKQAEKQDLNDYVFAMKVVKHVKSNAIVLVKNEQTIGIGPGQPNRITSAKIAINQAGEKAEGSILASDAFFPFADTVETAFEAGVKGIIQPGGSIRDQESIDFCNKHDLVMIFTGIRHFKH